jgi:hypothetical protein
MSTGIYINGVLVENIYGTKGAHTASPTGIQSNGTDLNAFLLDIVDGQALGRNVEVEANGTDLSAIFGVTPGALPIQGETFISTPTFAGGISTAILEFITNNATWSVTGSYSNTSGSVPSGAAKCQVTVTYVTGNTGTAITNPLASMTTLTGTNDLVELHLTAPQSSPITATYSIMIVYENSAGSTISTTTCIFFMDTAAS